MEGFRAILARDLALALRQGSDSSVAVLFFVLALVLFPLGIGPSPQLLAAVAPGLIWVVVLLAALLSLERLFQNDFEDGSLDGLLVAPLPLEMVALAKMFANWLATGLPLLLAAPLLALLLNMDASGFGALFLSLALGTPVLSLVGGVGAALTVGARRGGVLLSLTVLPLYIPVLIFGAGAIEATVTGLGGRPYFLILGGLLAASLALCPWAAAVALRRVME